jgi:hypothetical protein
MMVANTMEITKYTKILEKYQARKMNVRMPIITTDIVLAEFFMAIVQFLNKKPLVNPRAFYSFIGTIPI